MIIYLLVLLEIYLFLLFLSVNRISIRIMFGNIICNWMYCISLMI
nr:MAG TPA: hypothetical protein [Caudoviricetes sp.]